MENKWEEVYKKELGSYGWSPSIVMGEFSDTLTKKTNVRRLLDLGCGIGRNAIFLAHEGYLVVGMDISPTALQIASEKARKEQIDSVVFLHADMNSLPFPSGHFDAMFSVNVIHHGTLKEIDRRIGEISRVLRASGIGMVTIASVADYKYGKGKQTEHNTFELFEGEHREAGIPHHFFDESEVRLHFGNFKIEELKHIEGLVAGGKNCHWYVVFSKTGELRR